MQWLAGEWHFRRIFVDELRARGLPVEPVSFSLQGKVELHSRLKAAFEYAITPNGNLTLHARRDDHVDSLALAARPPDATPVRAGAAGRPTHASLLPSSRGMVGPVTPGPFGPFPGKRRLRRAYEEGPAPAAAGGSKARLAGARGRVTTTRWPARKVKTPVGPFLAVDPETAFWFLSSTAQAGAALAGLGIVAYVFLLRRTRDDLLAARTVEMGKIRVAVVRGVRTSRPLAWATRVYLTGATLALTLLLFVQPREPVSLGIEVGTYAALGLILAGNAGLVLFLRDPWRFLRDQVEVSTAGKLEIRRTDSKETGEEE